MKVREIMTRTLISLSPEQNVLEALDLLFEKKISGLPVIDKTGRLAGMLTEKNILEYILPGYLFKVGNFVYEENPKIIRKKFLELGKLKVSDIMRREVVTLSEDATLCEVAKVMLTQKARRIPIVDSSGRVIGIVARCDCLRALAKESNLQPE